MRSFYNTMAVIYVGYYEKYGEEKIYEFIFKTKVAFGILNSLYELFINEPDEKDRIIELGELSEEKKQKYWKVACKYFTDMPDRLRASKAVYVLELITSTF